MTIQDKPNQRRRKRRRRTERGNPTVTTGGRRGARPSDSDAILDHDDSDPATRGVQLLAQAFSPGQSFDRAGGRVAAGAEFGTGDERSADEARLAVSDGLTIARRTETTQRASHAMNDKDREQARLLAKRSPQERRAAQAWSDANPLRWRGKQSPYNPHEVTTWTATAGVAFVPVNPSATKTMRALARADLTGPLPHLLMFAATLELQHWAHVQRYLLACGHPAWACEEVALEFFGMDRTIADGAMTVGIRAQDWTREVKRARARVDDWLERAAPRIAENLAERGSLVGGDVYMVDGDARLLDGGERPRPARDPATYNCDEPSAMMAEDWWRPERLDLDRFGRRRGTGNLQTWQGAAAATRCDEAPAQVRIHLGDLDMLERHAEPGPKRVAEVCELLQRPTLDPQAGW